MCAVTRPTHARLFETLLNDELTGRLDSAAADGVTGLAEEMVAQAPAIVEEIENGFVDRVRQGLMFGVA